MTILFGALPATYVCYWAGLGVLFGFTMLKSGDFVFGTIILLWSLAGLFGALSLWLVAFAQSSNIVVTGLVIGLLAMLPLSVSVALDPNISDGILGAPLSLFVVTPPLVALAWIVDLVRKRSAKVDVAT